MNKRFLRSCNGNGFGRIAFLFGVSRFPANIRFGLVAHALSFGFCPTLVQAIPAVPRSGRLDLLRASFATFGAKVAFAFHGSFRASLLAGLENVLRHRNLDVYLTQHAPNITEGSAMNLSPVEAINRVNESVTVEMLVQRTK